MAKLIILCNLKVIFPEDILKLSACINIQVVLPQYEYYKCYFPEPSQMSFKLKINLPKYDHHISLDIT